MKEYIYDFWGWNTKLFLIVNHLTNNNGLIPKISYVLSSIFFINNFVIYYLLLCVYLLWQLRNYQGTKRFVQFTKGFDYLLSLGSVYIVFFLVYSSLKFSINFPRPYCSLPSSQVQTIQDMMNGVRCLSSFPSAHTGLALLIIVFLWPSLSKAQKFLGVLIVIGVGISRMTLAMHYPADIIYSCIITCVIICVVKTVLGLPKVRSLTSMIGCKMYNLVSKVLLLSVK